MVTPAAELGTSLLVFGGVLLAVPLALVLTLRVVDALALDDYLEQYRTATSDAGRGSEPSPGVADGTALCPHCGERNESEFAFCRSCTARVAV